MNVAMMRGALLSALVLAGVFSFLGAVHAGSGQNSVDQKSAAASYGSASAGQSRVAFDSARIAYDQKIAATYNYAFGKDKPFLPGNAGIEGDQFVQPGAFPDATYCQHCHQEAYHQWRQSLHSNAFRTPFYRNSVNILLRTRGIEFARHCDSCHNPIAVVSGGMTEDSQVDRKFDGDGLTCTVCHSIQKVKSTSGNGGYVMGIPSAMVDAKGNRIPGEIPYEEIMSHTDRHSRAVMQGFYRTPEMCAACHKANLPDTLNHYKFLSAFTTYDEWQNSKFSQRNPLTFYQASYTICQSCHMRRGAATLPDYGAKAGTFASHRWLAGNTAVPFYYGFDEQLDKTIAFLKSGDYLNVDIFGIIKASDGKMIGPLGTRSFRVEPNDVLETYVVIQNKNIGHSLIPEVRDLYQAWTEFEVKDAKGEVIYHSGFLKPDGELEPGAHSFTNRPVDKDGEFVDNHKVWTIHSVAYDNTIQAGRSTLVRYQFRVPATVKGAISITAKVNYRHFRESYLDNVFGKDHPAYPIVELASRTRTLKMGENGPTAAEPADNQLWMRWNNLGIGYLDELQYAEAVQAFNEVVKLRPDYVDGYTNVALADMQWEKYGSAHAAIQRALSLKPKNARALYYAGLIERRMGNTDAEMADLLEVVRQYPQSRDARRELGISYYQTGDNERAMEQFQALEGIDPDDVAAHYNLSILYRRMGMKERAQQELALFITEKTDPGAPTYSLDFLRKHPEISTESVPWHLHTDVPQAEVMPSEPAQGPGAQ
jgi:Flp pilus assembly protein TadD